MNIKLCDQEDCPCYITNEYRLSAKNKLTDRIQEFEHIALSIDALKELYFLISTLKEVNNIPDECLICNRRKDIDMYEENMAGLAKKELLKNG